MPEITWTPSQQRAIHTTDGHVMVTAAAGSGKTAVLAERCAYLVADLPKNRRIEVDRLLVVTFTEAAAAEMRQRVGRFIRQRLDSAPRDAHLARQLVQFDTAAISTLHAFCFQTLRRWFTHADIDPAATLMDESEADLLRRDVLTDAFKQRYADTSPAGGAFRKLVRDYAAGNDEAIGQTVLNLHGFLQSLVDPEQWLNAAAAPPVSAGELREAVRPRLEYELGLQADWADRIAQRFADQGPLGQFYAARFANVAEVLQDAQGRLGANHDLSTVLDSLKAFEMMTLRGKAKFVDDSHEAEALAKLGDALYKKLKTTFFQKRIVDRYLAIDLDDAVVYLSLVAEPKSALLDLARTFGEKYTQAKRDVHQLDFADLERLTLGLLTGDDSAPRDDLRQRYRYVLVDEFQDINPVQSAILDAIALPHPEGNLFVVGDVKQSIYRFRLAAPDIFRRRLDTVERSESAGACVYLQENFRSRSKLLEALNSVFRRTMVPGFGQMRYEKNDELRAPDDSPYRQFPCPEPPVECHLLDKTGPALHLDDDETVVADLEASLREAHLIARRIGELVGECQVLDRDADDPDRLGPRPADYRDICILLRSAKFRANEIKRVLENHDIPAITEDTSGFFDATEIRDVLALLNLIDNARQDIPLAAVLRSPLFGDPFSETDLAKLRIFDQDVPFHEAVFAYADRGDDEPLQQRLEAVLRRVADDRRRLRHRPLADVLWRIYKHDGYLAYVGGLRDGRLRRANLLALHERARAFGSFARQGLHRFLRYLGGLRDAGRDLAAASTATDDNAVRITTIHKAKGLEFPIVFLANAGKPFNDEDARGRVLIDRDGGIGLKVVDFDAKVEYPTIDHQRAAERIRLESRAEELRLLYVAATRAKEKLIVVGTCPLTDLAQNSLQFNGWAGPLPDLTLQSAGSYLDWILPCLTVDRDRVQSAKLPAKNDALFYLHTYDGNQLAEWSAEPAGRKRDLARLQRIAALGPLPKDEPRAASPVVDTLLRRLQFEYPAEELVGLPVVVAAGEIKRRLDLLVEPGESAHRIPPGSSAREGEDARRRGVATHRFLQLVELTQPCDIAALSHMRDRFVEDRRIGPEDAGLIDLDAVAWFFTTDVGRRLRAAPDNVHREAMFTIAQPPSLIAPNVDARDPDDQLLVRGIIDVLITGPDGLDIIDYKTDDVSPSQVSARAQAYRTQLDIYTTAGQTIWKRPVRSRFLVFLTARQIVTC